jgi:hypothetical protein
MKTNLKLDWFSPHFSKPLKIGITLLSYLLIINYLVTYKSPTHYQPTYVLITYILQTTYLCLLLIDVALFIFADLSTYLPIIL